MFNDPGILYERARRFQSERTASVVKPFTVDGVFSETKVGNPKRHANEDCQFSYPINASESLTPAQIGQIMGRAFSKLEKNVEENCRVVMGGSSVSAADRIGSTVTAVFIDPTDQGITLNAFSLGDSPAYVVMRLANGILECRPLTVIHHADSTDERKRKIQSYQDEEAGVCRLGKKDECGLMITRAVGDRNGERYGLSHIPTGEIFTLPFNCVDAFLVVGSDGFSNGELWSQRVILQCFSRNQNIAVIGIELMRPIASAPGDDVSVMIVPLIVGGERRISGRSLVGVADGHGGDIISRYVANNFTRIFEQQIVEELAIARTRESLIGIKELPTIKEQRLSSQSCWARLWCCCRPQKELYLESLQHVISNIRQLCILRTSIERAGTSHEQYVLDVKLLIDQYRELLRRTQDLFNQISAKEKSNNQVICGELLTALSLLSRGLREQISSDTHCLMAMPDETSLLLPPGVPDGTPPRSQPGSKPESPHGEGLGEFLSLGDEARAAPSLPPPVAVVPLSSPTGVGLCGR